MAEEEAVGLLQQLARDFNVRDSRKLFQIARREFPDRRDLTSARAAAALRSDVARQILAPKPRSLGKSAAEGPNDRLQADLIDFSQNTRGPNKFGLVVTDVFTREVATKALPDKSAQTVTRAAAEIIPELVQEERDYVVTTDLGNEFWGLEAALPGGAVHRQKDPTDRNATAVVDRAIQSLKKDLAGKAGRRWLGRPRGRSSGGLQCPSAPGGDGSPGGCGDDAGCDFSCLSRQRSKVQAQRRADEEPSAAARGGGGVPGPHQCGEELPAPVWSGAGGFELRLDDGASHGWLGDSAEACASGAPRIRGA